MSGKLGKGAFGFYVSLGDGKSYASVAEHYGVSKRAVVKVAGREDWTTRLQVIDQEARERADEKMTETMVEIRLRHQKLLRAMSSRVATALRDYPLISGMEAMRAAELVIKLERLVFGEATQRSAVSIEQVTRREIETLLAVENGEGEGDDDW